MLRNKTFDTYPLIIHAQGPHDTKPYWKPIRDKFFNTPCQKLSETKDLTILTWNNGHDAMGIFEQSMNHLGLPYLVLGQDVDNWVNSKHKPSLTYKALQSIKTKYVMGVDSRDAIIIDDPKIILDRYLKEFDSELIFSADVMNWPNLKQFKVFEDECAKEKNSIYKYLNSGAFIGTVEFCKIFFKEAIETAPMPQAPKADQGVIKQVFQNHFPKVGLDYHCKLFQNIGFVFNKSLEII